MHGRINNSTRTCQGLRCRGLTVIEILITLVLAAIVMMAAASLIPAYSYATDELNNLGKVRMEAARVHQIVQQWLQNSVDIVGEFTITEVTNPLDDRTIWIFVYTGDRSDGTPEKVDSHELEALRWRRDWGVNTDGDGYTIFQGTLERFYYPQADGAGTCVSQADLADQTWMTSNWASASHEVISENIEGLTVGILPYPGGGGAQFADLAMKMSNIFMKYKLHLDAETMPVYNIEVLGAPDQYRAANGC